MNLLWSFMETIKQEPFLILCTIQPNTQGKDESEEPFVCKWPAYKLMKVIHATIFTEYTTIQQMMDNWPGHFIWGLHELQAWGFSPYFSRWSHHWETGIVRMIMVTKSEGTVRQMGHSSTWRFLLAIPICLWIPYAINELCYSLTPSHQPISDDMSLHHYSSHA